MPPSPNVYAANTLPVFASTNSNTVPSGKTFSFSRMSSGTIVVPSGRVITVSSISGEGKSLGTSTSLVPTTITWLVGSDIVVIAPNTGSVNSPVEGSTV